MALLTIVGRWSPCPVLQQEARVFIPLFDGELFLWLLEDVAQRPLSYFFFYAMMGMRRKMYIFAVGF